MSTDQDFNHMRWACRRGLLELDLLLAPFVEECYRDLDDADKEDFRRLVTGEDQDLMNWIMGRDEVADKTLEPIVHKIRAHNRSKLKS